MTHDWKLFGQYAYPVCRICGIVKRRDGNNKPCKGPTRLRPMEGETPKALDSIVDVVLAYRPSARSSPALSRKRRANKIAKEKK